MKTENLPLSIDWGYIFHAVYFSDEDFFILLHNIGVYGFDWMKKHIHAKQTRERVIMVTILFYHGLRVFGSIEKFEEWLNEERAGEPCFADILNFSSGIEFVDNKLKEVK